MYTFGCNDEGALGRDTTEEGSETLPVKVDLSEKVVLISAGDSHTAALTNDGRVFIWGTFRVGLRCIAKFCMMSNTEVFQTETGVGGIPWSLLKCFAV